MPNRWDERKTGLEEEYFHRKEQDALEKTRQRLAAEAQERGTEMSVLHCPQCGEKLEVVSFHKIMIDRCASYQGVWLDPGEMECLTAQESQEGGLLRAETGQVVRDLFAFGDRTADEVMVPRVKITGIPLGTLSPEIAAILRASRHTRYPVYDGDLDHIAGVVHIKDLLRRLSNGHPLEVGNTRPIPWVPETSTLDAVLAAMRRERTQMVIVMDEYGGTAGIITLEDLFEEVIGDIEEGTSERPPISRDSSGCLRVAGVVRLDEVGESLNLALEHDEVNTVGGLVLRLLGRPARVGDVVTYKGVHFEVTVLDGHGVGECMVTRHQPKTTADP